MGKEGSEGGTEAQSSCRRMLGLIDLLEIPQGQKDVLIWELERLILGHNHTTLADFLAGRMYPEGYTPRGGPSIQEVVRAKKEEAERDKKRIWSKIEREAAMKEAARRVARL